MAQIAILTAILQEIAYRL